MEEEWRETSAETNLCFFLDLLCPFARFARTTLRSVLGRKDTDNEDGCTVRRWTRSHFAEERVCQENRDLNASSRPLLSLNDSSSNIFIRLLTIPPPSTRVCDSFRIFSVPDRQHRDKSVRLSVRSRSIATRKCHRRSLRRVFPFRPSQDFNDRGGGGRRGRRNFLPPPSKRSVSLESFLAPRSR